MRRRGWVVCAVATALAATGPLAAQGHGPIYGLSTPTLGKGGWSLDVGAMARLLQGARTVMVRPMVSYGVTEDLQVTGSVPLPVVRRENVPSVRGFTRMPASRDVEVGLGWRFQRRATGVGARQESTLWLAVDQPVDGTRQGLRTSPGLFGALVTGFASRTVYLWTGGSYRRYAGRAGQRLGDSGMASMVIGYRPSFFRGDYPRPDWRGFVEVVGEWIGEDVIEGRERAGTGGRQLFVALTALGLYGSWGIAGGPAFPVFLEQGRGQPEETIRFALNLTFWW